MPKPGQSKLIVSSLGELFSLTKRASNPFYKNAAKFISKKIKIEYNKKRPESFTNSSGTVYLLGVCKTVEGELKFEMLGETYYENGSANIIVELSDFNYLSPGGNLIYGYDISNKLFGVFRNFSLPQIQGGYVEANGLFQPLN